MSKKVTDSIRSEEMFSSYNNFPISMVFFFFLILCINILYNKFSHQRLLWNFCGSFLGFIWNEKLPPHNFFVIFLFVFGLKLFRRIDFSFQIYNHNKVTKLYIISTATLDNLISIKKNRLWARSSSFSDSLFMYFCMQTVH